MNWLVFSGPAGFYFSHDEDVEFNVRSSVLAKKAEIPRFILKSQRVANRCTTGHRTTETHPEVMTEGVLKLRFGPMAHDVPSTSECPSQ